MVRFSSRVVLVRDHSVALIRRERESATYYVFPGGGVEEGETFEDAAVREAYEELGVRVRLGALLLVFDAPDGEQRYYAAQLTGGTFGTGVGAEFRQQYGGMRGRYTPVWIPVADVASLDVRPSEILRVLPSLLQRSSPSGSRWDLGRSA